MQASSILSATAVSHNGSSLRIEESPRFVSCRQYAAKLNKCRKVKAPLRFRCTPRASTSEIAEEFKLEEGPVLKVKTGVPGDGAPAYVEVQVSNCDSPSLFLHWGAIKGNNGQWRLPSCRPPGTRDFHQSALQSPFGKSGDVNSLKIEVRDDNFSAIEFLLRDDARDRWFKHKGSNFRVELPRSQTDIPKGLVDIYAYVRWERNGKPNYTPEQEKLEYEAARKELEAEIANGASVDSIRKRFSAGNSEGKSPRKKASVKARISRKQREFSELINNIVQSEQDVDSINRGKEPTRLELALEGADGGDVFYKKAYKLGNKELLVLVRNAEEQVYVSIASDIEEALAVHWSLSQDSAREWKAPPVDVLPPGSEVVEQAVETFCTKGLGGDPSLQSVEIKLGAKRFLGLPFVLRAGDNWIKLDGSDFYIPLHNAGKKVAEELDSTGTAKWLLDEIVEAESEAERSLMHRYNIAASLLERAKDGGDLCISGILVWLRYMAMRQLTWNRNYNVKPREISAAQDRLTSMLKDIYLEQPQNRELIRLTMSTVGRGAQGDVGQRIRDEILVIQRNNDCKGGMMEEWHQKLHNNTSPDDVVICQALLDYVENDFNIDAYWKTLTSNGVTKERLASYDRPIVSEPHLRPEQKDGLIRDLTAYMRTLKAVHSGADLESAIETCMGYSVDGHDFMGSVNIHPIDGLSSELPEILSFVMAHVEDKEVLPLLEGLVEARRELLSNLQKPHERLKDIIFLDLALDSTVRTAAERGLEATKEPSVIIQTINLVLENLCLSSNNNEELVYCLKDWHNVLNLCTSGKDGWALRAKSVLDRTRLALSDKAEQYHHILQPTAAYLGRLLGVEDWAIDIFTEEMIRAGSAASLSILLNRLDPLLRSMANLGSWQVISPVDVKGFVSVADDLGDVQNVVYNRPTVLVCGKVKGEEEIPAGAVGLLTPDMPDVLSHVAVRARNSKVLFATCFDADILDQLRTLKDKGVELKLTASSDISFKKIDEAEVSTTDGSSEDSKSPPPAIVLKRKKFMGNFAISANEFTADMVGAKSLNTVKIRGKLPSWIKLPTSVALPFGVFEEVLSQDINKEVAAEVSHLKTELAAGDLSKLRDIREAVMNLRAPAKLVDELKGVMVKANLSWPGDEGEHKWEQAWSSIKRVWSSKWNERAYISTRKANIDHEELRMAVLVQEIVCADYAFVIHTTNPSNGDSSEIYAEIVKGLGETLVGAYPGRALSFVTPKSNLKKPKIIGYPSKRVGLFIQPSIIFRSDSNGEDLEGYAGAGLYDSVPMDREEELVVDYSEDKLLLDESFREAVLSRIAAAGAEIEKIYGTPQDVEGCIKDGELYIVQTRPQM